MSMYDNSALLDALKAARESRTASNNNTIDSWGKIGESLAQLLGGDGGKVTTTSIEVARNNGVGDDGQLVGAAGTKAAESALGLADAATQGPLSALAEGFNDYQLGNALAGANAINALGLPTSIEELANQEEDDSPKIYRR